MRRVYCVSYTFTRYPYREQGTHVTLTAANAQEAEDTVRDALAGSLAESWRIVSVYPVDTTH